MAKLVGLSRSLGPDLPEHRIPQRRLRTRFYAFLSYSHDDEELADWLHRELEKFRVPRALAGTLTVNGVVPRRLRPIFRDEHDLSVGADLAEEIKAALAASQFLVVLCSPTAAKSRWTNQEIESFKRTRPEGCILAAIASGEPFASDIAGREDEECFPPALRYKYDRRGHPTARRAEPLAADFRYTGEGQRIAFLKLVSGMLGVGLDELVKREQIRQHRRLAFVAAGSIAGMAVTSTLAVAALQARNEAREQRREAEGLVSFMLGDLKNKLEPIGRLDALDGVGSRVLAYYSKQEASELSDAALSQRSKALSLMAEVASARGDSATALKLYRQALTGTAEAMRRRPDDPGPIFDHAQNVFYVGQIAHADGDFKTAEQSFRDYQRLARAMVALQPDSMKYRMEQQYADFNLGVVLSDERRFDDAVKQFKEALSTMEAITLADPTNDDYRQNIAESLTWLADDERAVGAYDDAIAHRRRNVDLYRQLLAKSGDVQDRQHLIAALRSLADLYEDRGQHGLAEPLLRDAIAQADILEHVEANNAVWIDYAVRSRLDLARVSSLTGRRDEASQLTSAACRAVAALLERKAIKRGLGQDAIACNLARANLALGAGQSDQALAFAQQAVGAAHSARTVDKVADEFRLVRAYLILGDVQQKRGNLAAANATWKSALAAIPSGVREIPSETADHALILQRLGQKDEARPLASKLESMGYRRGFP